MTRVTGKTIVLDDDYLLVLLCRVKVGDSFYERAQLSALRLHTPPVSGIDTLSMKKSPYGTSIATSIVLAGGYEDDVDKGETFTYTGAGGK